jgi:3-hydroxyisobutyrate dehydrogenase-like beta-hydroxyacid dehydrogenase
MKTHIGFIGLGAMGKPMAKNLVKKGYHVTVYDIRPEPMVEMKEHGAQLAASPRDVAMKSEITITMLLSSPHVEEVVLGKNGAIEGFKEKSILIDMSSIDPNTTRKIGKILSEKNVEMLDAPVARGVKAATEGTLAIFVGGNIENYERCKNILNVMGTDVSFVGGLGCGEVVKLVNQLILSTTVVAIAEGMVLGVKGGVDPEILFKELCKGSANSFALANHFKNFVMKGNFGENIFPVDYILKDLGLVLSTGKDLKVPLFVTSAANQMYELARASGKSKNYFPVVIKILEEVTGVTVRDKNAQQ